METIDILHDNACGFGIFGNKVDQLLQYSNTKLNAADFENCYKVDYILKGQDDNRALLTALAQHPEYFGNHIEEVNVVIEDIPLTSIQVMGASRDSVKISNNGVDYIKFKDTDFIEEIQNNRTYLLTVYGKINLNLWGGRESVQVFINDYDLKEDTHRFDF